MAGKPTRGRGKRGIASFSKKIPAEKYHIDFDENNMPEGDMLKEFNSWYGMMVQHMLPYHIETHKVEENILKIYGWKPRYVYFNLLEI